MMNKKSMSNREATKKWFPQEEKKRKGKERKKTWDFTKDGEEGGRRKALSPVEEKLQFFFY